MCPQVRLSDNTIIQSTHQGHLPIPNIPPNATLSHTFPKLQSASFLSIRQLCYANCSAVFTKHQLNVLDKKNSLVLTSHRNYTDGLWNVPLTSSSLQSAPVPPSKPEPPSPVPAAYVVLCYNKPNSELAAYLHAVAGYTTKSSFLQAIHNGNFTSWPGLTADLISKHLLPSIATAKGHIRQEPKNL